MTNREMLEQYYKNVEAQVPDEDGNVQFGRYEKTNKADLLAIIDEQVKAHENRT